MTMDLFERSVLMSEVATFAVWAKLLSVKLSAVLRFILVVETCLGLSDPVDLSKLFSTMGVLAFKTIAAESTLGPVLAHLSFVFLGLGYLHHLSILHKRQNLRGWVVKISRCCWAELFHVIDERSLGRWNKACCLSSLEFEWIGPCAHVDACLWTMLALVSTTLSE